jgi:hypothetical protein
MSIKKKASELVADDVVDFATAPPYTDEGKTYTFERYAFAFGKVEDVNPSDDGTPELYVDFEAWGEHAFAPDAEFDVLTDEEVEAKLKSLWPALEGYKPDGWSVASDAEHKRWTPSSIQFGWANEYGEPGYTDPQRGILFANWNYVSKEVQAWLEANGFEIEWEDEWMTHDNGKAYRTSPTSYHWTPSWVMDDDGNTYTVDDYDGIIDALAMTDKGQPARLLPDWVPDSELVEAGFEKVDDEQRESGFFTGQDGTPEKDAAPLFDKGAEAVIFRQTEQSQFYFKWDVWVKWPEEAEQQET